MARSQWFGAVLKASLVALFIVFPAFSQETSEESTNVDMSAWQAASAAMQPGPQTIQLRDQAKLELPEGYGFIPAKEGAALMSALGNETDERFLGLVWPLSDDAQWFVTVDYEASGYIKDDDAAKWDADELLQSLKDGTEASNDRRKEMGIPEIVVTRWVESPAYDSPTHRLVWSAEARNKDGSDEDPTVNYNTYVLGREGYISLNLITSASVVESHKPAAKELLAAVNFNDGKRYSDFNASTDKVAAYGLAALVGGFAAKKLGLLAMLGVFLAKFGKLLIVGLIAAGGVIMKLLKGRSSTSDSPSS